MLAEPDEPQDAIMRASAHRPDRSTDADARTSHTWLVTAAGAASRCRASGQEADNSQENQHQGACFSGHFESLLPGSFVQSPVTEPDGSRHPPSRAGAATGS